MAKKSKLLLAYCSKEAARYAVEKWYYRSTMPSGAWISMGVWEDDSFRGVLIFGHGSGTNKHTFFDVAKGEVTELLRVAMRSHTTEVSRILSIALRILHKDYPHIRVVISYTDPSVGHTGGVYKAGNWVFVGETPPDRQYWIAERKEWVHSRAINHMTDRAHVRKSAPVRMLEPKHRYAYPLDEAMREKLAAMALPNPKVGARVIGATEEQSARAPLQVRGGGSASDPVAPIRKRSRTSR